MVGQAFPCRNHFATSIQWQGDLQHCCCFDLGLRLGFNHLGELEVFTVNRANLFGLQRRLNPVLASVIVQMTELLHVGFNGLTPREESLGQGASERSLPQPVLCCHEV